MRGFKQKNGTRGGYLINNLGDIEYIETKSEIADTLWDKCYLFRTVEDAMSVHHKLKSTRCILWEDMYGKKKLTIDY